MANPVFSQIEIKNPAPQAATAKPQQTQAVCLQEQFTGQIPQQRERPMAEILAERLAQAGQDSQSPLFIP